MKERYVTAKDLATGFKVFGVITKETYKSVEPEVKYYTLRKIQGILSRRKKI